MTQDTLLLAALAGLASDDDTTAEPAIDVLVEALGEWVSTVAAEHHGSMPFTTALDSDPLGNALQHVRAAVAMLRTRERPGLTVAQALGEAAHDAQVMHGSAPD